ncbi:MAG: undecaprenyl/decaprenyl-phosphate alpha-N-acetylglucosaminyl 1-phosphate transferase [Bacteroidales bacterium]|nr:undecaprenyl/decaprenyl-phosphate alpha-N-acetylglucosaminyl 1-phosphate transferase [Bacteroidales bacterium]
MTYHLIILLLGTGTFTLSILVNYFLLHYSGKRFAKDAPVNSPRWETKQKPVMGGISFFIGFIVSLFAYFLFTDTPIDNKLQICSVIACISLAFVLGLYDDLHNASVAAKFCFQFLIAIILIISGIHINCFPIAWINYCITILWVVGLINSLNMLDNMDGVTAMVSVGIISGILALSHLYGHINMVDSFILPGIACAVIGFLFFNFYPSKMYMGDIGSLTLGCTLAIFSILYLWNPDIYFQTSGVQNWGYALKMSLCVILIFIIPLSDTLTVFIKRIAKGRSPFVGDKGHTTHHLVYAGFPQRWVCVLYTCITLAGIVTAACILKTNNLISCITGCIYCLGIFGTLFGISLTHTDKE